MSALRMSRTVPSPRAARGRRGRRLGYAVGSVFALTLVTAGAQPLHAAPATTATTATPADPAAPAMPAALPGATALPPSQLTLGTQVLASGLGRVTAIAAPDDGSNRLLVAEKSGTVRVFRIGQGLQQGLYLDLRGRVSSAANERGLLGIATSRNFATTRTVVVAYTRLPDNAVTLSRFRLSSAAQNPVPASGEQVLITQPHGQFSNHNGGQVVFGPDNLLYWGIGDGGGAGDPLGSGQSLSTLLGKVVRVDAMRACDGRQYCVPADNPFVGQAGARPEIWALGLRNPWRFSFDRADRSLWIGDVGQNTLEEVDLLPSGGRGENLGWSCREGTNVFNPSRCVAGRTLVPPVFTYATGSEGCAVQGGFVYRGTRFAALAAGTYVFGDYCSGNAWGIQRAGSVVVARIGSVPARTTTFGEDQSGELYLGTDGGQLHAVTFRQR